MENQFPQLRRSSIVRVEKDLYRIKRYDGELVGYYETRTFAEKQMKKMRWL